MKKSDLKLLRERNLKALAPTPPPKREDISDELSSLFDDGTRLGGPPAPVENPTEITGVPESQITGVGRSPESNFPDISNTHTSGITGVPESQITGVPEPRTTGATANLKADTPIPQKHFYRKANEFADQIDKTLTPAESKVFEQLLRLTVGFNRNRCQVRVSALMERTGYTSDRTVRQALHALESKGRIRRLSRRNNPSGDEYEIVALSDATPVLRYSGTPVKNTAVLSPKITGHIKTYKDKKDDDEAFAEMLRVLRTAAVEVTGREASDAESLRWKELAELLVIELKIAASRAASVSSAPAFLTEHLRRRLMKKERAEMESESRGPEKGSGKPASPDAKSCPDCAGTGFYYPEGYDAGVAKCTHTRARETRKH